MADVKEQLQSISKDLAALSRQVNKLSKQVEKMKPAAKTTAAKSASKAAKSKAPKSTRSGSVLDTVYETIRRSRKGVSIAQLKDKTNLNARQLSNALYKLSKKGMIKTVSRGVYTKA
jgi:predicted Rossmann fold nucleotide-binding protein DprA/Smf involved in DNA uptake